MKKICIFIFAIFASLFMMGKCYAISEISLRTISISSSSITVMASTNGGDFKRIFGSVVYDSSKLTLTSIEAPNSNIVVSDVNDGYFNASVATGVTLPSSDNDFLLLNFSIINTSEELIRFELYPISFENTEGQISTLTRTPFITPYNITTETTTQIRFDPVVVNSKDLVLNLITTSRCIKQASGLLQYDGNSIRLISVDPQGAYNYRYDSTGNTHIFSLPEGMGFQYTDGPYTIASIRFELLKQPKDIGETIITLSGPYEIVAYTNGTRSESIHSVDTTIGIDLSPYPNRPDDPEPEIPETPTPENPTPSDPTPTNPTNPTKPTKPANNTDNPNTSDYSIYFIIILLWISTSVFVYRFKKN